MILKDIIRITTVASIVAYLMYCVIHVLTNPISPTYRDCGTIVSKSGDEIAVKNGVYTTLFLNIEFEQSGFKAVDVEPTTYFKFKVGDEICMNLKKEKSVWYGINNLIGILTLFAIGLVIVIQFVTYLLED